MDALRAMIDGIMSAILTPFAGRDPFLGVCVLGAALGVWALCVFRLVSNPKKIGEAKRSVQARLYELRLFSDEPALVWRAQTGLIAANARYFGLILMPALIIAIPFALGFASLDSFYGRKPLAAGDDTLVTVQASTPGALDALKLSAPEGIAIESPPVRAVAERQVSWRIRALRPVNGEIGVSSPAGTVEKSVDAGAGPRFISERRVSSTAHLLEYPSEARIANRDVSWIEIRYPRTEIHAAGIDLPWWTWLLIISILTALALKRPFRVTF
ncbi:MAG TPA: hypothetical protein VMG40_01900 [Bryobacteraceae bacterium]|nr:hypothetical protein [Bryobacteraceae bacterium]